MGYKNINNEREREGGGGERGRDNEEPYLCQSHDRKGNDGKWLGPSGGRFRESPKFMPLPCHVFTLPTLSLMSAPL